MAVIQLTESKDYHVNDYYTSSGIKRLSPWMTIIRVTESKDYHVNDYYTSNRINFMVRLKALIFLM